MYFLYITTNKINNKRYVGLSKLNKPGVEKYLGSGKHLNRAIAKYGRENFSREIIAYYDNLSDVIAAEKSFILEHECHLSDEWYNIAVGFTTSGFKGKIQTEKHRIAMIELLKDKPRSNDSKLKQSITRKSKIANGDYSFNHHTAEQLKLIKTTGLNNKGRIHKKQLCCHCIKEYGPAPFARFHGDKCKSKSAQPQH